MRARWKWAGEPTRSPRSRPASPRGSAWSRTAPTASKTVPRWCPWRAAHRETSVRSLFALLAQQRRFVYLLVGVLSAVGIAVAFRIPSAIYPELTFSRITVVVSGSSLGARQVLFEITRPIEEAVSIVPGVVRVQSRTIRGAAEINVTFAPKTDMQFALQQVQARVNRVATDLPPGLDVEIERLTPSLFPILSYNLEG